MSALDRFKREIEALVLRITRATRYYKLVPATVVHQAADGTLDLSPTDTETPPLVGVPIRHGLPGVTDVRVSAGTVVRVGFDAGDPRKPFAVLWDAGMATSITFNGSTHPLARTGDTVDCGTLILTLGGTVAGYVLPGVPLPPLPPGGSAVALSGRVTGTSVING